MHEVGWIRAEPERGKQFMVNHDYIWIIALHGETGKTMKA